MNTKVYVLGSSLMVIATVALLVLQAAVSSNVSTVGMDFSKFSEEINTYKKENAILKEKLLSESSYTSIAEEAEKEGFVPTSEQVTFSPLPLAHR